MDLIVKICGLSTEATMDAALDAGADMVGLVFFPRSPRFVSVACAASLADRARGRAEVVALIVDMDDRQIGEIVNAVRPDWLQLHGRETPERTAAIARQFATRTIKAVGVSTREHLAEAHRYEGSADGLLLDARPPDGADRPGGNGRAFDWRLLEHFRSSLTHFLSGGLAPENVAEAIAITRAPGVDVSSGVESAPGHKDVARIAAFVARARAAARSSSRERQKATT
jgi:phosphoribosylanthranilate isomerase